VLFRSGKHMYQAIGVKDINLILPPPKPPTPTDPVTENMMALAGKPFQAFPKQDHRSHIDCHLAFMATNMARNNPMILGSLEKNIFEHINLMAQEQVELEFRDEFVKFQQIQQNPAAVQQNPQLQQVLQQFSVKVEARKSKLEAEMMEEFLKEERKIMGEFGNDPIAKLRARELDLKAMDDQRKRSEGEDQINLDRMKTMMNQGVQKEKLDQNEDLAHLRADTSLTKTQMTIDAREESDRFKQRDVRILKGPRS
jgi:hypothetical protein